MGPLKQIWPLKVTQLIELNRVRHGNPSSETVSNDRKTIDLPCLLDSIPLGCIILNTNMHSVFSDKYNPNSIFPSAAALLSLTIHSHPPTKQRSLLANIHKQSQMNLRFSVLFDMLGSYSGNRSSAFSINQTGDQQLMSKTTFGFIHKQSYLSKISGLHVKLITHKWLIQDTNINRWISQQSPQTLYIIEQLHLKRYLPCYLA
jgi:hypothetical protein